MISPRRLTNGVTPGAVETKNLTASARLSVKRTQGEVSGVTHDNE